jgi:hypothetical protein
VYNDSSSLPLPVHPIPAGGQEPDLNLAGNDGFNVAAGASFQPMPEPPRPIPAWPTLQGSPALGGIDPQNVVPDLNLAGVDGVPTPQQLTTSPAGTVHQPDYGLPDLAQPPLKPYDLVTPGLSLSEDEFASDPLLPDLAEYHHPYGLDIRTAIPADLFAPDPLGAETTGDDLPGGLKVNLDPQQPDPLLPDLQDVQNMPTVQMDMRPADLAPGALADLHQQPLYRQVADVPYDQVYMQQRGVNSYQRRHNDLLMRGLDAEEH